MKAKDLVFRLIEGLFQVFPRQYFKNGGKKASLHFYGVRWMYICKLFGNSNKSFKTMKVLTSYSYLSKAHLK